MNYSNIVFYSINKLELFFNYESLKNLIVAKFINEMPKIKFSKQTNYFVRTKLFFVMKFENLILLMTFEKSKNEHFRIF